MGPSAGQPRESHPMEDDLPPAAANMIERVDMFHRAAETLTMDYLGGGYIEAMVLRALLRGWTREFERAKRMLELIEDQFAEAETEGSRTSDDDSDTDSVRSFGSMTTLGRNEAAQQDSSAAQPTETPGVGGGEPDQPPTRLYAAMMMTRLRANTAPETKQQEGQQEEQAQQQVVQQEEQTQQQVVQQEEQAQQQEVQQEEKVQPQEVQQDQNEEKDAGQPAPSPDDGADGGDDDNSSQGGGSDRVRGNRGGGSPGNPTSEGRDKQIVMTQTQFQQLLSTLQSGDRSKGQSEFKLTYKFQPFNGEDGEWLHFKKQLISYMNAKGVSRDQLKKYVADFREDKKKPPAHVSEQLRNVFSTSLRKEAVSITNKFEDGFEAYIALLERYEPKRTSRYIEIVRKMFGGMPFRTNQDENFRQFEELNEQLEQYDARMKDIYLVACISNSLPERLNNAKTAIGLQENITLKEAKAIIESVQDLRTTVMPRGTTERL